MKRKSKKIKKSKVLTIIFFALLIVCAGCDKRNNTTGKEIEFEVDKEFQRGPLTAHIRIDKTKINIAQTVTLELVAAIEPSYEVQMPKIDEILQNFGIIDWDNLGDKLDENNIVVSTYRYRLEPFLSGTFPIPAFTFEFSDVNNPEENKHELTTEPIDIEVASLLGEEKADLKIADIEGVVEIPAKASFLWLWLFLIIIIVVGIAWFFLRRKKTEEIIRIFMPAHEIAYNKLRALVKRDLVKAGKIKEFYENISDILRHYIEHRFNLRAPERTTEEFLSELTTANILSEPDQNNLAEFLNHCDLVKFAKYDPTNEQIQKTFDLVKNFIETTKSEEKKIDVTEMETEKNIEVRSA
jgi:hypothetical protein